MLCKSKLLTLVTMVHSWYVYEYCFMGSSGRFYSCYVLHWIVVIYVVSINVGAQGVIFTQYSCI